MTQPTRKRFLVLYLTPVAVLADWAKTDPATRQAAEEKMRSDWDRWMSEHAKMITVMESAGKTKEITAAGIVDTKNDVMLYSIVEAGSHEDAAKAFANHPHLGIPRASIQVTEVRPMGAPA
jgi:hypothetical protein